GHSQLKTGHPVRSAIHKQLNGRLVLRWVTTWESLLLYVLQLLLLLANIVKTITLLSGTGRERLPFFLTYRNEIRDRFSANLAKDLRDEHHRRPASRHR
ncbi:hypothetical protein KCU92_g10104, partial [Aureobasidium melanogenum]